ncbi:MAG: flagellar M-ring protein FliF C-terminal domain-containing protein, partial [Pseudomonadota bacterium]
GLEPVDVTVIDATNGVVIGGETPEQPSGEVGDRAAILKQNAERLLEARVGAGRAIVAVNLDVTTDREQITERVFDPDSRVAISTDTDERTTTSSGTDGAGVTVASNLPQGEGDGASRSSNSSTSQTQERVNYEVSETQREILRGPGVIERMTVAVLIDGVRTVSEDGDPVWEPRSQDEMAALRTLVASAVGLDDSRGDTLTIETLEFLPPTQEGSLGTPSLMQSLALDVMSLIQLAVLGALSLVIALFVLRPLLSAGPQAPPAPALSPPLAATPDANMAISGEIQDTATTLPDLDTLDFPDAGSLPALPGMSDDPADRLKSMVAERQDESREILRRWMTEDRETA